MQSGQYNPPVQQSYDVDIVRVSHEVTPEMAEFWRAEVARRFPGAVAVVSHGGEIEGEWFALADGNPDAMPIKRWTTIIRETQAKYPGRLVVVVSCNPTHLRLPPSVTGVAYSLQTVWVLPDNQLDEGRNTQPEIIGNIFEFIIQ